MVYFSDFFQIQESTLDSYGAFNISLINDLPLFVDPFLLFGSKSKEYQNLHNEMLKYLSFLKEKSSKGKMTSGQILSWYSFSEVKQNWLGYSLSGNSGSGLGNKFGNAMSSNMHIVFDDLNNETITSSSHMEKVSLFQLGVGKDNISDFTCNLIKQFLLTYTQNFAIKHLQPNQIKEVNVSKVRFDYKLERWMPEKFTLPFINNDFVLLTPKDILTKDDNWINNHDFRGNFLSICNSIPNDQLRAEIHNYFRSNLPAPVLIGKGKNKKYKKPSQRDISVAVNETIQKYPKLMDFYIKLKEENKEGAKNISQQKVSEVEEIFKSNVITLVGQLLDQTNFYDISPQTSYQEAMKRVNFLKDVIENKDGYRLFYYKGEPIKKESDLQLIYRLTWFSSPFDVNREVNNGRGPVDYSVSKGSDDKTLVEFKLASNSKLKMNLENQVEVYQKASNAQKTIKVIMYFDNFELAKVNTALNELNLHKDESIILIDASNNKPSASNVKN